MLLKWRAMEMRAKEEVKMGVDITPPIPSLAAALYDGFLHSHCSSCFSPLPTTTTNPNHLLYCSPSCFKSSLSSELHLLQSLTQPPPLPSTDLRAALRLLHSLSSDTKRPHHRIAGLLTNRDKFLSHIDEEDDPYTYPRIHEAAKLISESHDQNGDVLLEEAALCLVLTNALEVQDNTGRSLGIAVYDWRFSWINHSCSPNACYRFSFWPASSSLKTASFCSTDDDDDHNLLRIAPCYSSQREGTDESGVTVASKGLLVKGDDMHGPRLIVRSIKPIKKGEEVTITYTDLLQPKAIRQTDLSLKYQFVCSCTRCSASPPSYVDHVLQEISVTDLESRSLDLSNSLNRDYVNTLLTGYVDEAIAEYLSVGDPETCCDKLEYLLAQGLPCQQFETEDRKLQLNFRVHPLHYLALNSYTTLASAYKIRASDLAAMNSTDEPVSFNMSRISAAYSLLLAGAANYLFCSEPSLVASVANFWTNAGESLLMLATSSAWSSSLVKPGCSNCLLTGRNGAELSLSTSQTEDFQTISSKFRTCVANLSKNVWNILIFGSRYLTILKDPTDFSWLGESSHFPDNLVHLSGSAEGDKGQTEESISKFAAAQLCTSEGRTDILHLGIHCLQYGGFLANICYGQNSHLSRFIHNIFERTFQTDS